jgi:hypothetical protein
MSGMINRCITRLRTFSYGTARHLAIEGFFQTRAPLFYQSRVTFAALLGWVVQNSVSTILALNLGIKVNWT